MLAIILVIIGCLLRFMPHADNFTPVAAIALFSAAYLKKGQAFIVPLAIMVISDAFIGMHNVALFVWGAFILSVAIGLSLRQNRSAARVGAASLASSLVFFAVSNFGVWVMGWYPHNARGLLDCYTMALPFLRNTVVSTLCYSAVFFGVYELAASALRKTRLAAVLL